jgi:hypothetical protein
MGSVRIKVKSKRTKQLGMAMKPLFQLLRMQKEEGPAQGQPGQSHFKTLSEKQIKKKYKG